jgi:2,3-bisphosphoglycerate-independent phosphoglycerate mutase
MIGDGMADRPLKELGGKSPLQEASTPNMDRLAREGIIGYVRTIPPGYHPGSDVANLSILGYDPRVYYTGRAPLEAASMGVVLGDNDVAYRCNLVTLNYNKQKTSAVMEDYSAGHISSPEASILINEINDTFGSEKIRFYPGVSYRHLMVWRNGVVDVACIPPHDIIGKDITVYLPQGRGEEVLRGLMRDSAGILQNHRLNRGRIESGKRPANAIWLWGQGRKPMLQKFRDKYALEGALISAVDLTKGLGLYAGFEILNVPGVTGYIDTNYMGKAEYSLDALTRVDLVYIHVEAPDEAGHSGNCRDKIKAIEDFDALVVGTVLRGAKRFEEYRILIMPDHATPIEMRTHTDEPVPFVIFDSRQMRENRGASFNESLLKRDDLVIIEEGYKLMDYFVRGE